jgi:AcrR family transcriptional regulator
MDRPVDLRDFQVTLQDSPPGRRSGPRERLLRAGSELTYTHGVGVGVDAIIKQADVARRSLYEHFGSKDGLITEILRTTSADDERLYRDALDAGGDEPRARVLSLFDMIERVSSASDFRGCRYTAATLGLADDHPAHAEIRAHKEHVRRLLEGELVRLGHADPDRAASELLVLIEGALAASANRPDAHAGRTARALAERIIGS